MVEIFPGLDFFFHADDSDFSLILFKLDVSDRKGDGDGIYVSCIRRFKYFDYSFLLPSLEKRQEILDSFPGRRFSCSPYSFYRDILHFGEYPLVHRV